MELTKDDLREEVVKLSNTVKLIKKQIDDEMKMIPIMTVPAHKRHPSDNTDVGRATQDRIFLLAGTLSVSVIIKDSNSGKMLFLNHGSQIDFSQTTY